MDPLAQLQDIHLPQQVHNYPLAPGWWILLILVSMLTAIVLYKAVKTWRLNKQKRFALRQLNQSPIPNNAQIIAILKWTTMTYFPRKSSASLFGRKFQQFLTEQLPEKHQQAFTEQCGDAFDHLYQKEVSDDSNIALSQAAILWLKKALPPKKITRKDKTDNTGKNQGSAKVNADKNTSPKTSSVEVTDTGKYQKQGEPA
ncbi:DUF4381 domain-containing protein [Thalassomonas actiniarum]|uniref:DUF4381 domain-containing protein n=1 Tax=Thalassomonas actiniarum TaxID=485447 RepID=A0AAF0C2V7_9GAMM|nr:DUF4381 domain-containing protein [Thalassomonas actiniarum]WDE00567.1 DUF4381 domain-containing protein [Thalassomonas actiniarum]